MGIRRLLPRIGLAIALALAASLSAFPQASVPVDQYGRWVNGVSEPWWFPESISKDDITAVQIRWSAIDENTTSQSEEWTGNYFSGSDTHGSYLRLSKQNGFVLLHVNKCEARVMSFSHGKVVSSDNLIQLLPEKAASAPQNHGHAMQAAIRFLPVTWRGNSYLVPENDIADFGDYVAGLGKYNNWSGIEYIEIAVFFTRSSREVPGVDEISTDRSEANNLLEDRPVVPPGYERFIKKPIDALITAVGKSYVKLDPEDDWDDLITPVTINVGSAKGLKARMSLRVIGSQGFGSNDEFVKVTQVGLHSAKGIIERPVRKRPCLKFDPTDDCKNPDYQTIRTGWKLTTNSIK